MKSTTTFICLAAALLPALAASVHAQTPASPDTTNPTPPTAQSGGAAPPSAPAQPDQSHPRHFPKIGIDLGAFFPTDAKTRNRFGSVWTSVGLGIGSADAPPSEGRFALDIGLTAESNGSNYAYVLPVGIAYRRAFSAQKNAEARPLFVQYYGVSLDAVGVDLKSKQDNVNSGVELTGGGSITLGTTVGKAHSLKRAIRKLLK